MIPHPRESVRRPALPLSLLIAGVVTLCWFQTLDVDVFWHLKVGERILDTGRFVRTNVFSFAFPDHPWLNPEWLPQVAFAQVYRWAGWTGVGALKAALCVALSAVVYVTLLLAGRGGPVPSAALALATVATMRFRLMERPQLLSFLLFGFLLLIMERRRTQGDKVLLTLPPLFALWANVHPELLLGILYLGGAWVGERIDGMHSTDSRPPPAWPLGVAVIATIAASGVNPIGFRVLLHSFPIFGQDAVVKIREFVPATPERAALFWAFLVGTAAMCALPAARRQWARIIPLAGLAFLGIRYVRETPYFVLAAAPLVQEGLADLATRRPRPTSASTVVACAAALGFFFFALRYDHPGTYHWGSGVNARLLPVAAADFIARERLPPNLYNNYNEGGYLLWRLFPRMGVFQDGRISAYPEGFMRSLHASFTGAQWREAMKRYQVATVLVTREQGVRFFPREDWATVYWDERYCVLVLRASAPAGLVERLEYRHFLPDAGSRETRDPHALEASLAEMARSERDRGVPSAELLLLRSLVLSELGRVEESARTLEGLVRLFPDHAPAWLMLAVVDHRLGKPGEAKEAYGKAVRLDPELKKIAAPPTLAPPI